MDFAALLRRFVRFSKTVVALGLSCLVVLFACYLAVESGSNLHEVEAGVLYRSGQMPPDQLTGFFKSAGIRSVLNLRGEHVGEAWYDQELSSANTMGVALINYPISARTELSAEQLKRISVLIRTAEKPLLIHCGGGADRTGLACGIFCVDAGMSRHAAHEQLSLFYGHFPHLLWEDAGAMDVSLDRYLGQARVPLAGDAH